MLKPIQHHITHITTTPDYLKVLIVRSIGNFLVLIALFVVVKTFYQPLYEEARYFADHFSHKQYVVVSTPQEARSIEQQAAKQIPPPTDTKGKLAELIAGANIQPLVPQDPQFSILIPKIGANSRVISNVNPANESEYLAALQKGVAQAKGTAFPGEGGHIYLFAHSTDYVWNVNTYNAVFYLLYKLDINDEIDLFYKGQRYTYRVVDKTIVDPSQVEYLTRKTDYELLTLQTCWPPGTSLKRLLVFARRVAE